MRAVRGAGWLPTAREHGGLARSRQRAVVEAVATFEYEQTAGDASS
ncbi:hypothetical protein [Streptomyces sp. M41(2017)]|nr:hypothetical protein [Streptomyces sp. M41(2017)]